MTTRAPIGSAWTWARKQNTAVMCGGNVTHRERALPPYCTMTIEQVDNDHVTDLIKINTKVFTTFLMI